MSKAKVKVKVSAIKDEGLAQIFNQMLSNGDINLQIAYPKYIKIKSLCTNLVKLFNLLAQSPPLKGDANASVRKEILDFCTSASTQIESIFVYDFTEFEWNLNLVEKELKAKFAKCYESMKTCGLVNQFVIMCDRLAEYRKNFEDINHLDYKFIMKMSGVEWAGLSIFPSLNIKLLITNAAMREVKPGNVYIMGRGSVETKVANDTITFFMTILHKAYTLSKEIYETLQSPDIDIDEFVNIIMNSIDEIQRRPELHRCKEAFAKIKQSVSLLKTNFREYYRDFIGTNDNTIMMQNFILDVSKNTNADAKVAHQFRVIISYYQKISQNQTKDPRINTLFEKVNASFAHMDRNTKNLVSIDKPDENNDNNDSNDADEFILASTAPISELKLDNTNVDLDKVVDTNVLNSVLEIVDDIIPCFNNVIIDSAISAEITEIVAGTNNNENNENNDKK